jgi:hypothetical protein
MHRPVFASLIVLSAVFTTGTLSCGPVIGEGSVPPNATLFRIENATASAVVSTITVLDESGEPIGSSTATTSQTQIEIPVITVTPDGVSYGTLQRVGASAARAGTETGSSTGALAGEAEVLVPGYTISEGRLACGAAVEVSMTIDGQSVSVLLTGDGSGTPEFDAGSVGEDGKRFLIHGRDFVCGEAVVLRVDDDGTKAGSQVALARGRVAVVPAGSTSPFSPIVNPGTGGGDGSGDGGDTDTNGGASPVPAADVSIEVVNQTTEFLRVAVMIGSGSLAQETNVFVPPGGTSTGQVDCVDSYTLTAYSLTARALTGLVEEVLIVLTGDGTGATSFDSGSVGQKGQRVLQAAVHYACGDDFVVTITDPGSPGFVEPSVFDEEGEPVGFIDVNTNNIQDAIPDRLGSGTVEVQ